MKKDVEISLYEQSYRVEAEKVMEWVRTSHESITGRDGYKISTKKISNVIF